MDLNDKELRKIAIFFVVVLLGFLVFLAIKPIFLSVIGGLLLAYVSMPIYTRIRGLVKNNTLAASIVSIIVLLVLIIPAWFLIPLMVEQVFEIFRYSQKLDVYNFIKTLFPNSTDQFLTQISIMVNNAVAQISASVLNYLSNLFLKLPTILLNIGIVAFVFFFTLRDSDVLQQFAAAISPINKNKEKLLVEQFRAITDSIVYGQVIVGLVQGIFAGLGFLMFGVDNAVVLTILAIVMSIIPFIGPAIVWVPVAIFMYVSGNSTLATLFLAYNLIIVSTVDNIVRTYIVSRKTKLSPVFVFVGMIGGLFLFGILGLVLGPLLLAYFLILLNSYKEKTLGELFTIETSPAS